MRSVSTTQALGTGTLHTHTGAASRACAAMRKSGVRTGDGVPVRSHMYMYMYM